MFFTPTLSWEYLESAITILLFDRAVARILLTRPAGLSGVPAVREPSKRMTPSRTVLHRASWTQRSTWFRNLVSIRSVLTENPPNDLGLPSSGHASLWPSEFGTWKRSGPHLLNWSLSGLRQTATALIAKSIPVSVSPTLTLDASHATMGITSLTGWMVVLFIVLIDWRRERSRSSSTSPSSMPISVRLTGRGLTMVHLSPTFDFSDN